MTSLVWFLLGVLLWIIPVLLVVLPLFNWWIRWDAKRAKKRRKKLGIPEPMVFTGLKPGTKYNDPVNWEWRD